MSDWDWSNPDIGDMTSLGQSLLTLTAHRMQLFSTRNAIDAARTSVGETQWGGDGGAAWLADLTTSHALAQQIMDGFRAAANVISAYTAEVEEIKTEMAVQRQLEAEALELMRWSGEWYNPLDHLRELGEQQLGQSQMQQTAAAITALAIRRQDADNACVRDMAAALPENWSEQRAAFAAVGLESVDDLDPQSIADAMFELSNRLTASDAMQYDDVEMLDTFYELYGNDPEIMSQYFGLLGGEGTVEVIDMLAHQAHGTPDAVDAALLLRQSLSMVSLGWDQATAEGFADGLFTGEHYFPDGDVDNISAVGFLFGDSDEAPMGPQLALTTAVRVEELELATGNALQRFDTGMADHSGTNLLWREEGRELGEEMANPPGEVDISALVLETLGRHPEHALEFLSGNSPERITHWYQDRDWSMDGFEGAGALWNGVQYATADPADPHASATALAQANSEIMFGLAANESFVSEHLSDEGSMLLGAAIGLNFDTFSALIAGDYPPGQATGALGASGPGSWEYFILGSEEQTVPGAAVNYNIIQKLLGEVGANPTGALTLEVARALHEEHYFSEAGTDRDRFENAMERTNVLSGLIDGSAAGATLESAVRADAASDAQVQGIMDLITGGIGLVDMRVPHPVGVAIGIGINITADAITSAWQEALHEYDDIAAGTAEVIDVDQRIAMYANAERYYDFLQLEQQGVTAPPERDGYDSEAEYVDAYGDWYDEVIEHPSMPANGTADYDNSWALAWGLAAGDQGASVQNGTGDDEG